MLVTKGRFFLRESVEFLIAAFYKDKSEFCGSIGVKIVALYCSVVLSNVGMFCCVRLGARLHRSSDIIAMGQNLFTNIAPCPRRLVTGT